MATVRYLVRDVDAAISFYTGHLGFTLEQQMGPAFAVVTRDDLLLWLSGPQSSAARPMPDGRRPEPGGWNRLVVEVEDLETKVAELRKAGATFRNEIVTGPGGKQIVLDDVDGNPVELFEPRQ
jgi:catechol 2,3-dioxygenase-like lactoylglutathione lyase family enzyme